MGVCTQEQADAIVERCKNAVDIHGGQSDELANVRERYAMFEACREDMAYTLLDEELNQLGL